jgi:hypothetical protein
MRTSRFTSGRKWFLVRWLGCVSRIDLRRVVFILHRGRTAGGSEKKDPPLLGAPLALVLSLVLAAVTQASPTTFAKVSLEQLSSAAPLIVRARCQGSIVSAVRGEIWTITSFEVREVWKGNAPAVVRVRLLGGRTAEMTSHVEGVPRFRAGEDVVLFLAPLRRGDYSVAGWAQGTFRIQRGAAGASLMVTQDTASFSPAAFAGGVAGRGGDGGAVRGLPLEEFRRRVRELLAERP